MSFVPDLRPLACQINGAASFEALLSSSSLTGIIPLCSRLINQRNLTSTCLYILDLKSTDTAKILTAYLNRASEISLQNHIRP